MSPARDSWEDSGGVNPERMGRGVRMSEANQLAFEKVARGLGLIYTGLILVVLAFIGAMVAGGIIAAQVVQVGAAPAPGQLPALSPLATILLLVVSLLAIVGGIMDIVGKVFCLAIPDKTQATTVIQVSVACTLIGLVLNIVSQVTGNQVLSQISSLLSLVAAVVFMIFLIRLGRSLGRFDLADKAKTILTGSFVLVAAILVAFVGAALQAIPAAFAGILVFVTMIGLLILFVMYVNLISAMKQATAAQARGMALE